MKLTHASVFSGIGGPEIAAAMLGWDNVFHCEINDFGRAILEYWFPKSESYGDIKKTDFRKWRGKVDVLTGGFPCQPFSYAGQRRGADDDRYLWPEFKRVISEVRPAWVVGENVAGIVTMVEPGEVSPMESQATLFGEGDGVRRYRQEQPFTIERVCKDLEGLGYAVQPVLVPACAVGAPHRRDRVFIVGRRVEAVSQNAMHGRQLHGCDGEQGSEWHIGNAGTRDNKRICREASRIDIADTDSARQPASDGQSGRERKEMDGGRESIALNGIVGHGAPSASPDTRDGIAPDSERIGWYEGKYDDGFFETAQQGERGKIKPRGADCQQDRWRNFPSVSPVHRGDDGLPFSLDDLAIPASKWRTESLKAYGNAIVPQVMYEIFRAIEIVEREKNQ